MFAPKTLVPVVSWLRLKFGGGRVQIVPVDSGGKAWWDPVLGLHVVLQTEMAGVSGGSWFRKVLSTLSSASIAMSHISRLSARTAVMGKCNTREKSRSREGSVW